MLFNDDNILKSLAYKPESLDYLNQFGLLDNEIREWPVSFFERVLTNDIFNIIKPCLTEKELNKIKYNKKYL